MFTKLVCAALAATSVAFAPSARAGAARAASLRMSSEDELKGQILSRGDGFEGVEIGGIEQNSEIPADVSFEAPALAKDFGRWDGELELTVSPGEAGAGGKSMDVFIAPDSMTMEDYYAGFADAPAWISVSPQVGKLDRKGGEETVLTVTATPSAGESYDGPISLVVVLPDDIDKAYKINLKVGDGVATGAYDAGSDEELD